STFAVDSRLERRAVSCPSAIAFHVFQMGGAQNFAIVVASGVRFVLVSCPRLWTSLMAAAQSAPFRAGGGGSRNWGSLMLTTKGATVPQLVNTGVGWLGGVVW